MPKALLIHLFSRFAHLRKAMSPTTSCIFCKIASGEAKAEILYRDDLVTAFRDIHPVAPTHVLIIPNQHIESINHASPENEATLGHLFVAARKIAEMESIQQGGYRTIINTGADGGQTVFHLHMHVIGGQRMRHPMG